MIVLFLDIDGVIITGRTLSNSIFFFLSCLFGFERAEKIYNFVLEHLLYPLFKQFHINSKNFLALAPKAKEVLLTLKEREEKGEIKIIYLSSRFGPSLEKSLRELGLDDFLDNGHLLFLPSKSAKKIGLIEDLKHRYAGNMYFYVCDGPYSVIKELQRKEIKVVFSGYGLGKESWAKRTDYSIFSFSELIDIIGEESSFEN